MDDGAIHGGRRRRVAVNFSSPLQLRPVVNEGAFGLLKERFRVLKKPLEEKSPQRSVRTIVACLVLHNFFSDAEDETTFDVQAGEQAEEVEVGGRAISDNVRRALGVQKRNDLSSVMLDN